MPFDPTKPETGSPLASQQMREQLNGLKALIDAVPAGPPGPAGPVGPVFANVQVTSVSTGAPGTPVEVVVNTNANDVMLDFTIPQGEPGSPGVTMPDVNAAIASEIAGTARNPTSVSMLSIAVSNPPTQGELQAVVDKVNELIVALKR